MLGFIQWCGVLLYIDTVLYVGEKQSYITTTKNDSDIL